MVNETRTALLLIDYQVAMCQEGEHCRLPALAAEVARRGVLPNAAAVLAAGRAAGLYVVHVRVAFDPTYELRANRTPRWDAYPQTRAMLADSPAAQIVTEVAPLAHEPVVIKGAVDPFIGTSLMNMLIGNRVDHIVVAGVATNLAVESAVRHAGDSGLRVTVIEDACASFSQAAHEFSVQTILPMFASLTSTADFTADPA